MRVCPGREDDVMDARRPVVSARIMAVHKGVDAMQALNEMRKFCRIRTCFEEEPRAFSVLRERRGEDIAGGVDPDDHAVVTHGNFIVICVAVAVV
jgi:hypothetical protein